MAIEIKVPALPESVNNATIAAWHKKVGESVKRDERLVDIETDKVVLEVVAPQDGSLESILKDTGAIVESQELIAMFKAEQASKSATKDSNAGSAVIPATAEKKVESKTTQTTTPTTATSPAPTSPQPAIPAAISPAVRQLMAEKGLSPEQVQVSPDGRITKESVMQSLKAKTQEKTSDKTVVSSQPISVEMDSDERLDKRIPMTRLRQKIAERLVEAKQQAAILTSFNEVNMAHVMELRQKYRETFEKAHGIRLGYMSFFTLAVVEALKHFPIINASVEGQDIIYHNYFDIGIAVSTDRGLVVPVVRNASLLSMADIEKQIASLAEKARNNKITLEELTGGTFTITNGGVFGSLMSTPIINPPQSAILGMHKIEERPVVENGQIVIRPMMYLALSYDHRIIDAAESVKFLVMVKELLEEPARLALGI